MTKEIQLPLLKFLALVLLALVAYSGIAWAEETDADGDEQTSEVSAQSEDDAGDDASDSATDVDDEDSAEAPSEDESVAEGESLAEDADAPVESILNREPQETAAEEEVVEEETVDINELLNLPDEEAAPATATEDSIDDEFSQDDEAIDRPDRPSARGVGGKEKDAVPAQSIETESVDTGQAEAAAERALQLKEEEAEIFAKQKELERRQRIERGLDEQIQDLKEEALLLGKELRLLSEKLIYPSSTQVTIFISLKESDEDYLLDSIELKMNGQLVGSHLYTLREIDALRQGGVQRIFDGNLRAGEHFLELVVNGREDEELNTLNWRYDFNKGTNPHFVELRVFQNRITAKSW
ncbi:MAG: hypothetical protein K0U66_06135 [Gammaproteobacteria bacterium]|nr:hypothetical protein [Gammaproteobacteria bacterium]